jgi:hypothetical protein
VADKPNEQADRLDLSSLTLIFVSADRVCGISASVAWGDEAMAVLLVSISPKPNGSKSVGLVLAPLAGRPTDPWLVGPRRTVL